MKFKDYTWDKEFEIKGYFSERSDSIVSKNSLSGILHYSPKEIALELFGEFEEETDISFDLVSIWKRYMVLLVVVIF